jgi:TatD DNase family protein
VSAPVLVDSHCHVAEPEFDDDRDAVLARAAAAGVTTLVCVGATGLVEDNARTLALVGRHGPVEIVATVGLHPHHARTGDDAAFAVLERLAGAPGVVALGETGLDFHYDFSPRDAQRAAFVRSVALARRLRLPLVVHVRTAYAEAADVLRGEQAGDVGGVIHCFTGDRDDARRYLDLGFHVSIAGIVTFRNAETLRDAVRAVPADRLLVETDSPYLAPVPHRGRRNEPAWVRTVAESVAAVRGEPFEALAAATTVNARRVFRLDAALSTSAAPAPDRGPS